jgi:hypothetical protein
VTEIVEYKPDIDLIPLLREWRSETKMVEFGIQGYVPDTVEFLKNLTNKGTVLVLMAQNIPVGIMGLCPMKSPVGPQQIANEHFWYISPHFRGYGRKMLRAAEFWSKGHGCSHLIVNASYMASDLCDKVSKLYELLNFSHFEKSFIKEVA